MSKMTISLKEKDLLFYMRANGSHADDVGKAYAAELIIAAWKNADVRQNAESVGMIRGACEGNHHTHKSLLQRWGE